MSQRSYQPPVSQNTLISQALPPQHGCQPVPVAQYDQVFRQTVIPQTMAGQKWPHAETTVFQNTANNLKEEIIIIDSRFRDWDHETQSNYTYYLGQQLEYVQSIELVDGTVPHSNHVINQSNNLLVFSEMGVTEKNGYADRITGPEITITIPSGVYDIDQLCTQIGILMTEASQHHVQYICNHNPQTNLVTIETIDSQRFNLLWSRGTEIIEDGSTIETSVVDPITHRRTIQKVNTGRSRHAYRSHSIGPIIGFLPFDQTNSTSYTGQQVYNLHPDQYVSLYLTNETNEDSKNVYAQTNMIGVNGAFAILNLSEEYIRPEGVFSSQFTSRRRFTRYFNPPIKISRLRIEIKKPDGEYYDFHGLDHSLMLVIQRVYNRELIGPVNHLF